MDGTWTTKTVIVIAILLTHCSNINGSKSVEMSTKLGNIIGKEKDVIIDGKVSKVNEFLGIPFAKAPLGNLRFKKPEKRDVFREPFNATSFGAICPQSGIEIVPMNKFTVSEDCLYLNIYVPRSDRAKENFAVMIFIHGGLFITGASNFYVSDVLSAFGDVIVVTFNYRLSIFGFLSTHDDNAKGNFGLWDQQLAIQWVHENIESFHGNPNRVTLFGQSAGAASAIYQALYPGNRGMFQRVIAESGTPVSFGSNLASKFGETDHATIGHITGCPYISSEGILECLREKRTDDIMHSVERMFQQVEFEPVIDEEFILCDPQEVLDDNTKYPDSRGIFASVDLLIGGNSMEGASYLQFMWKALLLIHNLQKFHVTQRQFKGQIVPKVLQQIYGQSIPKHAADAVSIRYTDIINPRDPEKIRDMLLKLSTDYGFRIPNLKTALLHQKLGPSKTYVYEFKAHPTLTIGKFARPGWVTEANHGDESAFVFGFSRRMLRALNVSDSYTPTKKEVNLSRKIMRAWTNFAKYGNPSPSGAANDDTQWPEFSSFDASYLEFGLNDTAEATPREGYGEPGGSFWLRFMPHVMQAEKQLHQAMVTCDDVTDEEDESAMNTSVCGISLIALGACTLTLSLSIVTTCYYFQRKKKQPVKYDAVEL